MAKKRKSGSNRQMLLIVFLIFLLITVVVLNIAISHFYSLEPRAQIVLENDEVFTTNPSSSNLVIDNSDMSPGEKISKELTFQSAHTIETDRSIPNQTGLVRVRAEFFAGGEPTEHITFNIENYKDKWTKGEEWFYFNNAAIIGRHTDLNFDFKISENIPTQQLFSRISLVFHIEIRSIDNDIDEIWGDDVPAEWPINYEPRIDKDMISDKPIDIDIDFSKNIEGRVKNFIDITEQGFSTIRTLTINSEDDLDSKKIYMNLIFKKNDGFDEFVDSNKLKFEPYFSDGNLVWEKVEDSESEHYGWFKIKKIENENSNNNNEEEFSIGKSIESEISLIVEESLEMDSIPPFEIIFQFDVI